MNQQRSSKSLKNATKDSSLESSKYEELQRTKPTENTTLLDQSEDISFLRKQQERQNHLKEKYFNQATVKQQGRVQSVYFEMSPSKTAQLPVIQNHTIEGGILKNPQDKVSSVGAFKRKSVQHFTVSMDNAALKKQSQIVTFGQKQAAKQSMLQPMQLQQQYNEDDNTKNFDFLTQINEHVSNMPQPNAHGAYDLSGKLKSAIKQQELGNYSSQKLSSNNSLQAGHIKDTPKQNQINSLLDNTAYPDYSRRRDFTFRPVDRAYMFEGLPFVQFENFVRKDKYMQKNIIRDLLKILGDKCYTFKSAIFDRRKLAQTFLSIDFFSKIRLNQNIEQLVGVIETIVLLILHEFKPDELDQYGQDPSPLTSRFAKELADDVDGYGIGPNPLQAYRDKEAHIAQNGGRISRRVSISDQSSDEDEFDSAKKPETEKKIDQKELKKNQKHVTMAPPESTFNLPDIEQPDPSLKKNKKEQILVIPEISNINDEPKILKDNCNLFDKMTDFMRDTIDAFRIMSRQRDYKPRTDTQCFFLLKCITLARYTMGEIQESIRIYELNNQDNKHWKNSSSHNFQKGKISSQQQQQLKQKSEEEIQKEEFKKKRLRLQTLLQNKFNFQRGKFQTRESKVTLNDERFEQEKRLLQEMNQDPSELPKIIADNRKKVAMERLKNPFKDPDIAYAIKVARSVPNLNLPKNLFSN